MNIFGNVCLLLCGLGVFLTGMELMSDGLEQSAGSGVRNLFRKVSDNRLASYGLGFGTTLVVQSSSASIIMSLGLVNAGIMTLRQSFAFALGAHAGTTITGILVSLSSFKITPMLMALALVGICLILFVKKESVKGIGYILTGIGVLFAGMYLMDYSIESNPQITVFFTNMFAAIDFPLLLILIGIIFTAIIQSSSAVSGILVVMITAGTLDASQAIFLFIGATVGTCGDVLLASIGGSTDAKRTAFLNILSTIIGVLTLGMLVWIFKDPILRFLRMIIRYPQWQLSIFNVLYSIISSFITLIFIYPLVKLASRIIKDKKPKNEYRMYFIDELLLKNPGIAIMQAKKEVEHLALLAKDNLVRGLNVLLTQKLGEKEIIIKSENEIDFITRNIGEFLVKISSQSLGYKDEKVVGSMHHIIDDIERIGDHAEDFMKQGEKMYKLDIKFSDAAYEEIRNLEKDVMAMYATSLETYSTDNEKMLPLVSSQELKIHTEKKRLSDCHVDRLGKGDCSIETGTYFYTVLASLERISEHLENVAFAIRSITGSATEVFGSKDALRKKQEETV